VHQAAQQPIVLTVLASNSKWILKNDKVISDDRALSHLLLDGKGKALYDVMDWLIELSSFPLKRPGRPKSDRARHYTEALSLMTNLITHLDNWADGQDGASLHLQLHTHSREQKGSASAPRLEVRDCKEETASGCCTGHGS
jgi:hypothetical protein